ncbi:hypothetical protein [Sorangium sp. So ce1151]|uniref:hypothetical protein n=1 Tax=Sorangium sp. So ce1151 TaxID=3133332 RepID=UPI003F5E268F
MSSSADAVGAVFTLLLLFLLGPLVVRLVQGHLARLHAIRSIPLPRQATLISGNATTLVDAVLLDVFDTEYRRTVNGEPHYERWSAEEIAELRVFLFPRAFSRKAPRVLFETEVGVPLQMKLQKGDPEVCEWVLKRLKANPPLFGKADTIDDLCLKPDRFRRFLWTHCVGSSPVLFLEELLRGLPVSIPPLHRLPSGSGSGKNSGEGEVKLPGTRSQVDQTYSAAEHVKNLVAPLRESVQKALETGAEAEIARAVADARTAVLKAAPSPYPQAAREFLEQLDGYAERLATFEAAFEAETSKPMDDWAPWVREALAAATAGGSLAELGEDAMLDVFKRQAHRLWVTSSTDPTTARGSSAGSSPRGSRTHDDGQLSGEASGDEEDDEPVGPASTPDHSTDKGSEIGF